MDVCDAARSSSNPNLKGKFTASDLALSIIPSVNSAVLYE